LKKGPVSRTSRGKTNPPYARGLHGKELEREKLLRRAKTKWIAAEREIKKPIYPKMKGGNMGA